MALMVQSHHVSESQSSNRLRHSRSAGRASVRCAISEELRTPPPRLGLIGRGPQCDSDGPIPGRAQPGYCDRVHDQIDQGRKPRLKRIIRQTRVPFLIILERVHPQQPEPDARSALHEAGLGLEEVGAHAMLGVRPVHHARMNRCVLFVSLTPSHSPGGETGE